MLRLDAPPRSLSELGVGRGLISGLVLRHLAAAGTLSGAAIQERLALSLELLEPVLAELTHQHFVERKGHSDDPRLQDRSLDERFNYHITGEGRHQALEIAQVTTHYLGPCPVGIDDALELIRAQAEQTPVEPASVEAALAELELDPELVDAIGTALHSRDSVFLYGPPGNGKSTIARCMAELLGDAISVPYAVAVGDDVVRVLDPIYHRPAEGRRPTDRRLALVSRPLVRTGGELQLSQLELTYDRRSRYYEASLQWKASGGLLVIDDFGRQNHAPSLLLNRFTIPMEEGIDYLDMHASGKKIEVPFTCQVVFSSNLAPRDLVDEAFLRRIAHKIYVDDPSREAFRRIFERECGKRGLDVPPEAVDHLFALYGDRPSRGSHPKAIVGHLTSRAAYRGLPARLTPESLTAAFENFLNPRFG